MMKFQSCGKFLGTVWEILAGETSKTGRRGRQLRRRIRMGRLKEIKVREKKWRRTVHDPPPLPHL